MLYGRNLPSARMSVVFPSRKRCMANGQMTKARQKTSTPPPAHPPPFLSLPHPSPPSPTPRAATYQISKRNEVGSKFIVCIDSPEPHQKARVITGTVSAVDQPPTAEPQASSAQDLPPPLTSSACMIHGDGRDTTAQDWVDANGDIREGQRLSAWVY